ncbi:glycosyltransferase [Sphingomonas sp. SUN019]|uniref:glycosyltransferase n=1 Tax=Sphingomonas sp. SUN019 TaxID=2937788 RepID=UPI002164ABA5|nr:glycosyltransferase [Sphingomonas sp. SUN019]UVO51140.1 glycosyltransferase [Sphingomonas sp. SUN019]
MKDDATKAVVDLVRLARKLLDAGRPAQAIDPLEAALALAPADADVRMLLGEVNNRAKRHAEARTIWQTLMRDAPAQAKRLKLPLKLAKVAEVLHDHADAERHYDAHLALSPEDVAAQNKRLSAGLSARPPEARRAFAAAHFESWGENPIAARIVALTIGLDDDTAAAAALLTGNAAAYQGEPAVALAAIDQLVARGIGDGLLDFVTACCALYPDIRFVDRRLRVLRLVGASDEELLAARGALAAHPSATDAHRLRYARALVSRRRPAEGLGIARDILRRTPGDVEAAETAIRAADRLERYELSNRLLTDALAALDDGPGDLTARAQLLIAGSRNEETLEMLARLRADAQSPAVQAMHFTAAYHHGDYRLATRIGRRLVESGKADAQVAQRTARAEAALQVVPDAGVLFPDVLFDRVLRGPSNRDRPATDTIAIATSTLAAGGAERQVALTAANTARGRAGRDGLRTILLARSLDPAKRHDVMLPIARADGLEIDDLSALDQTDVWRDLAAIGAPGEHLALIAAFPEQMAADIANLYLRFRQSRPRVVHLWQDGRIAVGSVAAVLAGVPRIVAAIRNVLPEANDRRRYRRYLPVMYAALGTRDDVRFTTNSQAATMEYSTILNVEPSRIRVVRNGLEVKTLQGRAPAAAIAEIRTALGFGDAPLMGGVFRLAPAKRPDVWIRTAAMVAQEMPNARFVIVGDGLLRAEMEALVEELGLTDKLIFAGPQSPVEPWMAAMDVFVLTSSVEGLPNVLLEAQALGVPVVTTDAGGAREATIHGVTGRLVRDETIENLARAAIALLRQPSAKIKCRVGGPTFIESRFGVDRMIKDTMTLYDAA